MAAVEGVEWEGEKSGGMIISMSTLLNRRLRRYLSDKELEGRSLWKLFFHRFFQGYLV